jgi:RNA polymerase sigma-70 factor (ECF subfamily)
MKSRNRYAGINPYALACVRYHARRLINHPCFTPDDYEDIEQDLVIHFLLEWPKFDPTRSSERLHISMIIKMRVIYLMKEAEAQKRGGRRRPDSINRSIFDDDGNEVEWLDTIASDAGLWGDAYLGWNHLSADLRLDIDRAISQLPPPLADICERLKTSTITDVARETGIPRTTINDTIKKLREILGKRGLRIYL